MKAGYRNTVEILSGHRPKTRSNHKGATWDTIAIILPDGTRHTGWVDTTWGMYVYFTMDNKWKKVHTRHVGYHTQELDLRRRG